MNITEAFRQIDEENSLILEHIFIDALDFELEPLDIDLGIVKK